MSSPESPSAPLLRPRQDATPTLASLLGRATGRRSPSILVRDTAARHLEQRRADWGYSAPVVALDVTWNLAFVVVTIVMLACTVEEEPNVPIRIWLCGYGIQSGVHVALVWLEYRRRRRRRRTGGDVAGSSNLESDGSGDEEEEGVGAFGISSRSR